MSNGRADESSERGDDGNRRTVAEPGGGPRRVVSEKSVDDILASLGDATGGDSSEGAGEHPSEPTDGRTTGETATDDRGGAESPMRDEAADATEPSATDESGAGRSESAASSAEVTVDDADGGTPADHLDDGVELTYEDDDALAGRVAANDVTGADVRAAETDPDRESTPEIDDVDLSLDDLEDGQIGGATAESESARDSSDDGSSSAGSTDDAAPDDESEDGSPGLFRRLLPW